MAAVRGRLLVHESETVKSGSEGVTSEEPFER